MGNKSSLLMDRHDGLSGERRDRSWSFTGNMSSPTLSGLKGSRHRTMSLSQHPSQSQDRQISVSKFRLPGVLNKSKPQEIRPAEVGPHVFSSSMSNVSQVGQPHSWAVGSKEFNYGPGPGSWRIPHIQIQESTDPSLNRQNMVNWSGRYSVTRKMELQREKRVSINKRSNMTVEKSVFLPREFPVHLKDDMDLESNDDFFNEGFRERTNSTSIIEIGRKGRSRVVMGAASANLRRKQQFTPVTKEKYSQETCTVIGNYAAGGDYVELDPYHQAMSHEQQNLNNEQLYLRGELMGKGLKEKVAADEVILPPFKESPSKMNPKTWKGKKFLPDIHEEKILSSSVPNCSAEFLLQSKAERQLLPSFLQSPNMDKFEADFLRKRSHSISNASGYVSHQPMSWNLPQGISGADNREILIHYSPFCVRKFAKKSSESTMTALKPKLSPQPKERAWNYNMSLGDSCSNLMDVSSDGKGSGLYSGQNKDGVYFQTRQYFCRTVESGRNFKLSPLFYATPVRISRVQQDTSEEGWGLQRPKRCDDNTQDENSCLNNPNYTNFVE